MRTISREEHELLLNLFIMNLMFDVENLGPVVGFEYEIIKMSREFILFKDCFPMDEVCEDIREDQVKLSCGCCYGSTYKPANYIQEV